MEVLDQKIKKKELLPGRIQRLHKRVWIECPYCHREIHFGSRVGIHIDILIEFLMFSLGVLVGGCLLIIQSP